MRMNKDSSRSGWPAAHESPIDRALDRAVRDMMHVDPPPGLRRRVLARVEPRVTGRWMFMPGYALAAAALAILVLGGVFVREHRTKPIQTGTIEPSARTAPVPQPRPAPSPNARGDISGRAPATRITRELIPMPRVTNVFGSRTQGVSAARRPGDETAWPAAATVTDTPVSAVAPIVIEPIETLPLVIPPLVTAAPPLKGGL